MKSAKPLTAPEGAEVFTLQQAAAFLQTSPHTLMKRAATGELPGRRLGSEWRFTRTDLLNWISNGNRPAKTA
ncbi:MAG TPA: helix-turn-helix domain-containing protein [Steroidobacteraceae bacterium]|jgi:excisionase family DNA binding protein|nr:helix-turn-helix domain-containing protein [Steroidobacteraceae bacterium]